MARARFYSREGPHDSGGLSAAGRMNRLSEDPVFREFEPRAVLVQPDMESGRSPLVSIPPSGGGDACGARRRWLGGVRDLLWSDALMWPADRSGPYAFASPPLTARSRAA